MSSEALKTPVPGTDHGNVSLSVAPPVSESIHAQFVVLGSACLVYKVEHHRVGYIVKTSEILPGKDIYRVGLKQDELCKYEFYCMFHFARPKPVNSAFS